MMTACDRKRLYFITDTFGNYYRLNGADELVAAAGRQEAGVFTGGEIQERLCGKKAQFYTALPVPETVKAAEEGDMTDKNAEEQTGSAWQTIEELSEINWIDLLENFAYIVAMLPAYKDRLTDDQSKADLRICDILHFVEMYEYDGQKALDLIEELKETRERRRIIKNELYRVECFRNAIGSTANAARAKEAVRMLRGKESGKYRPRVAEEWFEQAQLRPRSPHQCYADLDRTGAETIYETEACFDEAEEEEMEYIRKGTVFDDRKVDWLAFVQEQAEFFREARQHITDLQIDLENIDATIEEALVRMEDANFNVTQGYRAFKELKNLRNTRKEILTELETLQLITERFDCPSMQEAYEAIEDELTAQFDENTITDDMRQEQEYQETPDYEADGQVINEAS